MDDEQNVKLTADGKPRVLGEEMVKKIATVTRDAITINITSTKYHRRAITYCGIPKFRDWEEEMYKMYMEEQTGVIADDKKVHKCKDKPLVVELKESQYGSEYTFHVLTREINTGVVTENYKFAVRAELSKTEMNLFLTNILNRVNSRKMEPAFFYRNFTAKDEQRINDTNSGYFEMNLKMKSGHRSSPLYRKLDNVVYFSCKLYKLSNDEWQDVEKYQDARLPRGYKLPPQSPFGDLRASYKASKILNEESVAFLGGMHCYGSRDSRPHYVTVVICQRGSLSYLTCLELGLIPLALDKNPLLKWDKKNDMLSCASELLREGDQKWPHDVWIEIILCDRAIALSDGYRTTCKHIDYSSEHKSSTRCESCHGYAAETEETEEGNASSAECSPVKRRSMESSTVPEKTMKQSEE